MRNRILNWSVMNIVALGLCFTASVSMAGSPNVDASSKATDPKAASIEMISLARTIISYGMKEKDSMALMLGLKMLKTQSVKDNRAAASKDEKLSGQPYQEALNNTQETLVKHARKFSSGDKTMLAIIDDVAAMSSRGAGGQIYVGEVAGGVVNEHVFDFNAGELAAVYVEGDGSVDLDLMVFDDNGNLICADTDNTDVGFCQWTPAHKGRFVLKIDNIGSQKNEYVLMTN